MRKPTIRLSRILEHFIHMPLQLDCDVSRLVLDSREVQPGDAFVALPGLQVDGRKFIDDAIVRGAKVVLQESDDDVIKLRGEAIIVPLPDLRNKLGTLASRFYGQPSQYMKMYAVTGTNGKTSCTHFLAQCLERLGVSCGLIGTLGSGLYGNLGEAGLTTPDAINMHRLLSDFAEKGAKATAMEVSSHSIDQGRVNGMAFDVGIFTNLTQDHLDYHGDMQTYANVKKRLFTDFPLKHAVINTDDAYGCSWIAALSKKPSVFAYGLNPKPDLPETVPYITATDVKLTLTGIEAVVSTPWGEGALTLPLIGEFNLLNALAVLTALCASEVPFAKVLVLLANISAVPGRMQVLGGGGQPLVVVDYSHTPDSLEKSLQALKLHAKGKLICVFGCGGDRDAAKRPLMAKAAERLADSIIVTNDNPRHEDPQKIADDIIQGFDRPQSVLIELNRSKAIQKSIQCASINDCILIAGKGAERYQQVGDDKHPFDDVLQASQFLKIESGIEN